MGLYRKAVQLAQTLGNSQQSPSSRANELSDRLMGIHGQGHGSWTAEFEYSDFSGKGAGVLFQFSRGNVVIRGHIKFHPDLEWDPNLDNTAMRNFHCVIEALQYQDVKGNRIAFEFSDDLRDSDNTPCYGQHRFFLNSSKASKSPIERMPKPRLNCWSKKGKVTLSSYPKNSINYFRDLANSSAQQNDLADLLRLVKNFTERFFMEVTWGQSKFREDPSKTLYQDDYSTVPKTSLDTKQCIDWQFLAKGTNTPLLEDEAMPDLKDEVDFPPLSASVKLS